MEQYNCAAGICVGPPGMPHEVKHWQYAITVVVVVVCTFNRPLTMPPNAFLHLQLASHGCDSNNARHDSPATATAATSGAPGVLL